MKIFNKNKRPTPIKIILVSLLVLIVVIPIYTNYGTIQTDSNMIIRDKQIIPSKDVDIDNQNRIMAKSNDSDYFQEYTLQDSILHFNFNSMRTYNRLEVGECFDIKRTGWRIPWLSMYPNIINIEKVPCTKAVL